MSILINLVNKYNNTYYSPIKIEHIDVKSNTHILTSVKKLMIKIRNLNLLIMLEYQNIRMILQTVTLQINQKKLL